MEGLMAETVNILVTRTCAVTVCTSSADGGPYTTVENLVPQQLVIENVKLHNQQVHQVRVCKAYKYVQPI